MKPEIRYQLAQFLSTVCNEVEPQSELKYMCIRGFGYTDNLGSFIGTANLMKMIAKEFGKSIVFRAEEKDGDYYVTWDVE